MAEQQKKKSAGYDKFINWRLFIIPLGLLILLLILPTPKSMVDVGVEYVMGPKYVKEFFAKELFGKQTVELSQWQVYMVKMMETSLQKSSFSYSAFLKKAEKLSSTNETETPS